MSLNPYSANDPYSMYDYNVAGIDPSFTANLLNLGYSPVPFASQRDTFQNQLGFMRRMKQMMDQQLTMFQPYLNGAENQTAALPFNSRNYFGMAQNAFQDPLNSPNGSSEFFGGGYKMGDLPDTVSKRYQYWTDSLNHPNVPAPIGPGGSPATPAPVAAASNSGGGGGGSGGGTKQFTVGLNGGGSITVNAHDAASAIANANAQTTQGSNNQVKQGAYQNL
jgi:hypothetical protein